MNMDDITQTSREVVNITEQQPFIVQLVEYAYNKTQVGHTYEYYCNTTIFIHKTEAPTSQQEVDFLPSCQISLSRSPAVVSVSVDSCSVSSSDELELHWRSCS